MEVDIAAEAARLRQVMDKVDAANIFISEGAGVESIVNEMKAKGRGAASRRLRARQARRR